MASISPPGRSTIRGSGLPARSSRLIVLVTKAPSRLKSFAFSSPSAKAPQAGITGLRRVSPPILTERSTLPATLMAENRAAQQTRRLTI